MRRIQLFEEKVVETELTLSGLGFRDRVRVKRTSKCASCYDESLDNEGRISDYDFHVSESGSGNRTIL